VKRAVIIHGWEGFPEEGWFPWLKKELEGKGYSVEVPSMPHPAEPSIEDWVAKVSEVVGEADSELFLVGHSIGCQTVLRYLQTIDVKIGGVLLVAGFVRLLPAAFEDEGSEDIAKPWLETPLDWEKIKSNCDNTTAIFSQDDPFVPVEDGQTFAQKLGAKIIILNGLKHVNGEAGVLELAEALDFFR